MTKSGKSSVYDIRHAVREELSRRGWTPYRLAKSLSGRVGQGAVYAFLRKQEPTDMTSQNLGHLFEVLGWKLPPN
jgi:hypothetical protein